MTCSSLPCRETLAEGVEFYSLRDDRFKTARLTAALLLPMKEQTAAAGALLPHLLRSGCEDIESFSSVFTVCYSTGGNMRDVMRRTHDIITDKMAVSAEIETKITSNRLELNVITAAPVFLMLMLRATNESFAEKFATPGGVAAITVAIVIFVFAARWGRKIMEVRG